MIEDYSWTLTYFDVDDKNKFHFDDAVCVNSLVDCTSNVSSATVYSGLLGHTLSAF